MAAYSQLNDIREEQSTSMSQVKDFSASVENQTKEQVSQSKESKSNSSWFGNICCTDNS